MAVNQPLIDALERLTERWPQQRKRSGVEAPIHLTQHYIDLVLAYGFAELGTFERSAELMPKVPLDSSDPTHGFLHAAFSLRIEEARGRVSPVNPETLRRQFAALDGTARYRVNRVRELLESFEPGDERVDAASLGTRIESPLPVLDEAPREDEARARYVEQLVEQAGAADIALAPGVLSRAFHALRWVSEERAAPLIVSAFDVVRKCESAEIYGRAIDAMGWCGWAELMEPALVGLDERLTGEADVVPALRAAFAGLRRLGLVDEVARLLPHAVRAKDPLHLAGARMVGGDRRGKDVLANAIEMRDTNRLSHDAILKRLRMISRAFELAPVEDVGWGIDGLMRTAARGMTDSFGTNSHFCISILQFVDMLVMAIVRGRIGNRVAR